jgi:hypothetical protein
VTTDDDSPVEWLEGPAVTGFLVPADSHWRDDKVLIAELSRLNTCVARYIFRYLDADAGQVEPISVADEHALGLRLAEVGEALQRRAAQRGAATDRWIGYGRRARRDPSGAETWTKPGTGHGQRSLNHG